MQVFNFKVKNPGGETQAFHQRYSSKHRRKDKKTATTRSGFSVSL